MENKKNGSNDMLTQSVMDKLTKVCVCSGISRAAVKKAAMQGAADVDDVNKITGAGSGSCHGRRCAPKIAAILQAMKENE